MSTIQQAMAEWDEKFLRSRQITTILAMRQGRLEAEWHEQGRDSMLPLYSCTKSVLSALVGIALSRNQIASVDVPLSYYWSGSRLSGKADRQMLERVTLEHLLVMTPGFDWPDFDKPYNEMKKTADPVSFVLDRPIVHTPGEAFTYNSGGSHLLSAILSLATGRSALEYARAHLFEPLGIAEARWTEQNGVNDGGTGLSLYGLDLLKFGELYAQGGRSGCGQLLTEAWISRSTKLHHRALLQYNPPIYGGYGYHWWISPAHHNGWCDCYFAYGFSGQYLLVAPEHELVVVVRRRMTSRREGYYSRELIVEQLFPLLLGSGQQAHEGKGDVKDERTVDESTLEGRN